MYIIKLSIALTCICGDCAHPCHAQLQKSVGNASKDFQEDLAQVESSPPAFHMGVRHAYTQLTAAFTDTSVDFRRCGAVLHHDNREIYDYCSAVD